MLFCSFRVNYLEALCLNTVGPSVLYGSKKAEQRDRF